MTEAPRCSRPLGKLAGKNISVVGQGEVVDGAEAGDAGCEVVDVCATTTAAVLKKASSSSSKSILLLRGGGGVSVSLSPLARIGS